MKIREHSRDMLNKVRQLVQKKVYERKWWLAIQSFEVWFFSQFLCPVETIIRYIGKRLFRSVNRNQKYVKVFGLETFSKLAFQTEFLPHSTALKLRLRRAKRQSQLFFTYVAHAYAKMLIFFPNIYRNTWCLQARNYVAHYFWSQNSYDTVRFLNLKLDTIFHESIISLPNTLWSEQ